MEAPSLHPGSYADVAEKRVFLYHSDSLRVTESYPQKDVALACYGLRCSLQQAIEQGAGFLNGANRDVSAGMPPRANINPHEDSRPSSYQNLAIL